ncbi:MAG: pimeloyl-ACP methyl ester carboxylesterase [Cyclobacteriaceae bacterium]|jgi:pimeloyl-ACP methyl ester carboxylesterase
MIRLIRLYFKTLSAIAPSIAGSHAFELFQRTGKKGIRKNENRFYNMSRHFKVSHHLEEIDCYEMGNSESPMVLLVHGWDSNAGSMGGIAFELVEQGYFVVAFNLPAHGFSKLKKANIKTCREYFLAVTEKIYPNKPFSVIAHSFGSAVTTFALEDSRFEVDKLVFLTNPNKFHVFFEEFRDFIQLGGRAFATTVQKAETLIERPINEMNIEDVSKQIKYNRLLLIHDKVDKVLPYKNSIAVQEKWENTQLLTIEKIGHYRMLWNEHVINSIVKFLEPNHFLDLKATDDRIAS